MTENKKAEDGQRPAEPVFIGFRLPVDLMERAQHRMAGRFQTLSEYLRDLVRRDLEKQTN